MSNKVGKSKQPLAHQLPIISRNLRKKLACHYISIKIEAISSDHRDDVYYDYQICFQPGLDGTGCSINYFKTWSELLANYYSLMRGDIKCLNLK